MCSAAQTPQLLRAVHKMPLFSDTSKTLHQRLLLRLNLRDLFDPDNALAARSDSATNSAASLDNPSAYEDSDGGMSTNIGSEW
jgi:hypothetical protein